MAAKSLAVLALLNLVSLRQVAASFAQVKTGVVRIELTKHFQLHHEIQELEEEEQTDDQI